MSKNNKRPSSYGSLIECFVDGAARGQGSVEGDTNRGDGAAAVLIYQNRKLIGQYARGLGRRTNNEAEYEAVLLALILCWAANLTDPIIYSDSTVVVNQINKKWQCKSPDLQSLLASVKEIEEEFRFRVVHVKRNQVSEADRLANQMLDKLDNLKN